jgi:hypothetical protein
MNVFNLLNRLDVDLRNKVLFRDLQTILLCLVAPLKSLRLLDCRLVNVLLFDQCEHEDIVQQLLQLFAKVTILI